jgi:hypothetical protein
LTPLASDTRKALASPTSLKGGLWHRAELGRLSALARKAQRQLRRGRGANVLVSLFLPVYATLLSGSFPCVSNAHRFIESPHEFAEPFCAPSLANLDKAPPPSGVSRMASMGRVPFSETASGQATLEGLLSDFGSSICSMVERKLDERLSYAVDEAIEKAFAVGGAASRCLADILRDGFDAPSNAAPISITPKSLDCFKEELSFIVEEALDLSNKQYAQLTKLLKNLIRQTQVDLTLGFGNQTKKFKDLIRASDELQLVVAEGIAEGVDQLKKAGVAEHLEAAISSEGQRTVEAMLKIMGRAMAAQPPQSPRSAAPSRPTFPGAEIVRLTPTAGKPGARSLHSLLPQADVPSPSTSATGEDASFSPGALSCTASGPSLAAAGVSVDISVESCFDQWTLMEGVEDLNRAERAQYLPLFDGVLDGFAPEDAPGVDEILGLPHDGKCLSPKSKKCLSGSHEAPKRKRALSNGAALPGVIPLSCSCTSESPDAANNAAKKARFSDGLSACEQADPEAA